MIQAFRIKGKVCFATGHSYPWECRGHFVSFHPELQPLKGFFFLRFQHYKASDLVKSTLNTCPSTPSWIKMSQKCCKHSQPCSRGQFKQTLFCSFVWKSNFWSKEFKTFSPTHCVVRKKKKSFKHQKQNTQQALSHWTKEHAFLFDHFQLYDLPSWDQKLTAYGIWLPAQTAYKSEVFSKINRADGWKWRGSHQIPFLIQGNNPS